MKGRLLAFGCGAIRCRESINDDDAGISWTQYDSDDGL
jgi:hypothetical protein